MRKSIFSGLIAFLLIISACVQVETDPLPTNPPTETPEPEVVPTIEPTLTQTMTPIPSSTPLPTVTSSPTPEPTATQSAQANPPLSKQTFAASPVLFQFNDNACIDVCSQRFSALPSIILYSDGLLITLDHADGSSQLNFRQLSIPQMCQVMNTFDLIGFFNFDEQAFLAEAENIYSGLSPISYIEVNGWESNSFSLTHFDKFGTDEDIQISAESDIFLKSLYALLNESDWETTNSFPAEKTIMSIMPVDDSFSPAFVVEDRGEWDSYNFTLSGTFENAVETDDDFPDRWRIVDGNMSIFFHNFSNMEANPLPYFLTENGQRYRIETRPMIPFETMQSIQTSYGLIDIIPGPDIEFDSSTNFLTCLPEHGVLDIYHEFPLSNE